jgi:hypothetical protein
VWDPILSDHKGSLTLPDPKDLGFVSSDPLGACLAASDPLGKGCVLSDPRDAGSVLPDPLEGIPPCTTQGLGSQPWAGARAPTRAPIAPNRYGHEV